MPSRIALILLAAGGSTRMGVCKQLLPFRGRPLIRHAADTALATRLPVTVVLGDQAHACRTALEGLDLQIVTNPFWKTGMGASLRTGVEHAIAQDATINTVLVHLSDQPLVTTADLLAIIEAHNQTKRPLIAAEYNHTLGPPALIAEPYLTRLRQTTHEQGGAKPLLNSAPPEDLQRIPLPQAQHDLDTPPDYNTLQSDAPSTK
jgi:molybdenum cofactor cytidylyltransferase